MSNKEILERLKNDIRLRGLSQNTLEEYVGRVTMFMSYFNCPVNQLGEPEIREFLLYLKESRKLTNGTINTYNSALRFLYGVTLNKALNLRQIPRLKQNRELPQLLTQHEIIQLLDNTPNPMYRALFMTIYGSGLRVSEAVNIKVCDIDSEKMRIFIRQGKGGRDRYATLSQKALDELRIYWKTKRPTDFLFLTRENTNPTPRSVNDAFHASMARAEIKKKATIHTLRHCFATHLLENDINLFHIKKLLGHLSIRSTAWYLHFADNAAFQVVSPLDSIVPQND
jgi:site-specific recombinase XerD